MIAYHFTAGALIHRISREGLTKGALPWNIDRDGNPEMRRGFQWLTRAPAWNDQAWCMLGNLPYSRNAYRITIEIPGDNARQLFTWPDLVRRCAPDSAEVLNKFGGDSTQWLIFAGIIPPTWFLLIERNPHETLRASNDIVL